jgi:hypothetical protein
MIEVICTKSPINRRHPPIISNTACVFLEYVIIGFVAMGSNGFLEKFRFPSIMNKTATTTRKTAVAGNAKSRSCGNKLNIIY